AVVAVGFVGQVVDVKLLGACVVGAVTVILIRMYPIPTLYAMALTRAALEKTQDHHILHAIGVQLSPADLVEIAFAGGVILVLLWELRNGAEIMRSPIVVPAIFFVVVGGISLAYSPAVGEGARGLIKWSSAFGAYCL